MVITIQAPRVSYFNSIKVQLKLLQAEGGVRRLAHFNSIKVQLKLVHLVSYLHRVFHFNSIKVQLKPPARPSSTNTRIRFQFHKGTIKTIL